MIEHFRALFEREIGWQCWLENEEIQAIVDNGESREEIIMEMKRLQEV